MSVLVYLDSSAIVKRYIKEAGTEIMDLVFGYAEDDHIKLFFSIWNIGEVLGVFDEYIRRKVINEDFINSEM
jgi:predicted nucleic acid-binding protein